MIVEDRVCKDGARTIVYVWEIDDSKPGCWVEDGVYKFNSRLLNKYHLPEVEADPDRP